MNKNDQKFMPIKPLIFYQDRNVLVMSVKIPLEDQCSIVEMLIGDAEDEAVKQFKR